MSFIPCVRSFIYGITTKTINLNSVPIVVKFHLQLCRRKDILLKDFVHKNDEISFFREATLNDKIILYFFLCVVYIF